MQPHDEHGSSIPLSTTRWTYFTVLTQSNDGDWIELIPQRAMSPTQAKETEKFTFLDRHFTDSSAPRRSSFLLRGEHHARHLEENQGEFLSSKKSSQNKGMKSQGNEVSKNKAAPKESRKVFKGKEPPPTPKVPAVTYKEPKEPWKL